MSTNRDLLEISLLQKNLTPPGGLEPPTFRLTAERASRLRHGGWCLPAAEIDFLIFPATTQTGEFRCQAKKMAF